MIAMGKVQPEAVYPKLDQFFNLAAFLGGRTQCGDNLGFTHDSFHIFLYRITEFRQRLTRLAHPKNKQQLLLCQ
jgi:hypothetical protein